VYVYGESIYSLKIFGAELANIPANRLLSCSSQFKSPSPGGLPPGMALGCGLTSVRSNEGENYENEPLVCQKHIKKKT
jgi:hypothetical protein